MKRNALAISLLWFAASLIGCSKQSDQSTTVGPQQGASGTSGGLSAVKTGDKYGFIDTTGKTVIKPQFDNVSSREFLEGLAAVEIGGKWGYINTTGKFVIKPQFDDADEDSSVFSEGLAAVKIGGGLYDWGYIDKTGKIVIKPQFEIPLPFHEGLAYVESGYIDKTGKIVTKEIRHSSFSLTPERSAPASSGTYRTPDDPICGLIDCKAFNSDGSPKKDYHPCSPSYPCPQDRQ